RITDLPSMIPSSAGKLEMETWEEGDDQTVLEKIIKTAVLNVFRRHFEISQFNELVQRFDGGLTFEVSEGQPADRYDAILRDRQGRRLPGFEEMLERLRQKRLQQLKRYNLNDVFSNIRERLNDILRRERQGIAERVEHAPESASRVLQRIVKKKLQELDSLP